MEQRPHLLFMIFLPLYLLPPLFLASASSNPQTTTPATLVKPSFCLHPLLCTISSHRPGGFPQQSMCVYYILPSLEQQHHQNYIYPVVCVERTRTHTLGLGRGGSEDENPFRSPRLASAGSTSARLRSAAVLTAATAELESPEEERGLVGISMEGLAVAVHLLSLDSLQRIPGIGSLHFRKQTRWCIRPLAAAALFFPLAHTPLELPSRVDWQVGGHLFNPGREK